MHMRAKGCIWRSALEVHQNKSTSANSISLSFKIISILVWRIFLTSCSGSSSGSSANPKNNKLYFWNNKSSSSQKIKNGSNFKGHHVNRLHSGETINAWSFFGRTIFNEEIKNLCILFKQINLWIMRGNRKASFIRV